LRNPAFHVGFHPGPITAQFGDCAPHAASWAGKDHAGCLGCAAHLPPPARSPDEWLQAQAGRSGRPVHPAQVAIILTHVHPRTLFASTSTCMPKIVGWSFQKK
jgi:hypothetical protein